MRKLLQILLILMLMLTSAGSFLFSQSKAKSKITFFAPRSLYVYIMGSYNHFAPPEEHFLSLGYESADAFAPVFGVGYRVVNISDRFFISLEGDYSPATYDFEYNTRDQKISILTLMLNMDVTIGSRLPLVIFCGAGVGFHGLSDLGYEGYQGEWINVGDDTVTVLALDIGVKIPISQRLLIRSEFQWNGEVYSDYSYYDEYWDNTSNTEWYFLSSSFSMGIEFHF